MSEVVERARKVFALIDAMQSGKAPWSKFDELVTANFTAFVPGRTLDLNGFKRMMQSFGEAFSDGSHTLIEALGERETAMVYEVWRGTHTGVFLGAKPTGQRVEIVVMVMLKFEDEKVREFHETFDTLGLMQATGVVGKNATVLR